MNRIAERGMPRSMSRSRSSSYRFQSVGLGDAFVAEHQLKAAGDRIGLPVLAGVGVIAVREPLGVDVIGDAVDLLRLVGRGGHRRAWP